MKIDLQNGIKLVKEIVENYLTSFLLIIASPNKFFADKKPINEDYKKNLSQASIYVSIGLLLGFVLASSISVDGNMKEIGKEQIFTITVPYLFTWIIYGLILHLVIKLFGGKGTIWDSVIGLLYILATLHPILLFILFTISSILHMPAEYGLTVRSIVEYADYGIEFAKPGDNIIHGLAIGGVWLKPLYWGISFLLTCFYLYFPLKVYHQLTFAKSLLIYIVGLFFIFGLVFIGVLISLFILHE